MIIRHEGTSTRRSASVAGSSSARISMIRDEPSTSATKLLNFIPQVDPRTVEIANAEIMITLPESTSKGVKAVCTSSKRGRPNKFIALQNGDIVKQVMSKPEKKEQGRKVEGKIVTSKRLARKRNKSESDPALSEEDESTAARRSSRKSAGKSVHYKDFEEATNEDDKNEKTIHLPGVTIKKVGRSSKPFFYICTFILNIYSFLLGLKRQLNEESSEKEEETETSFEKPKRGRRKSEKPVKIMYDEYNLSLTPEEKLSLVTCGACEVEMPLKK